LAFTLLAFTLLAFTLLTFTLLAFTLLAFTLLAFTLLTFAGEGFACFSDLFHRTLLLGRKISDGFGDRLIAGRLLLASCDVRRRSFELLFGIAGRFRCFRA